MPNNNSILEDLSWISIKTSLPNDGETIIGANGCGDTWEEIYDKEEPLGSMIAWKYK